LTQEWQRYKDWPQAWLALGHPHLGLAILLTVAIVLAIAALLWDVKRRRFKDLKTWSAGYLLAGLIISILFLALSDSRKAAYYLPYITPWLAACLAIQMADFVRRITAPKPER